MNKKWIQENAHFSCAFCIIGVKKCFNRHHTADELRIDNNDDIVCIECKDYESKTEWFNLRKFNPFRNIQDKVTHKIDRMKINEMSTAIRKIKEEI